MELISYLLECRPLARLVPPGLEHDVVVLPRAVHGLLKALAAGLVDGLKDLELLKEGQFHASFECL